MRNNDPDETEGRALYRARADALANAEIAYGKRAVKLQAAEPEARDANEKDINK